MCLSDIMTANKPPHIAAHFGGVFHIVNRDTPHRPTKLHEFKIPRHIMSLDDQAIMNEAISLYNKLEFRKSEVRAEPATMQLDLVFSSTAIPPQPPWADNLNESLDALLGPDEPFEPL